MAEDAPQAILKNVHNRVFELHFPKWTGTADPETIEEVQFWFDEFRLGPEDPDAIGNAVRKVSNMLNLQIVHLDPAPKSEPGVVY